MSTYLVTVAVTSDDANAAKVVAASIAELAATAAEFGPAESDAPAVTTHISDPFLVAP